MKNARRHIALIALAAALGATPVAASGAPAWKAVKRANLEVTEGTITSAGKVTLRTRSAATRAAGPPARRLTPPAELAAGLEGPIGVRSDNGDYLFRLSARR